MAWSGGNFTRANPTWTTDASLGIGIEAGRHDAQDNDFTTGIDQCLNKTGQNSMTGDLNLGGYRPTNVAAGTAAAPALCVANDVNTGIFQAAAASDTLSIATGGTERMRIDSNGATGISTQGDTASETVPGLGRPQLQVKGTGSIGQIAVFSRPGNGDAAFLTFCKSRGSTTGSYTAVQTGDNFGQIGFLGATGTDFRQGAAIVGVQDGGTISATSMPGRLVFSTTSNGDTVPAERMRITSDGSTQLSGRLVFLTTTTASGTGAYASAANTFNISTNSASRVQVDSVGVVTMSNYGAGTATFSAAGVISSTSDERVKIKDGPIENPLEKINALTPGYWLWKEEVRDELGSNRELGFFAQNVYEAIGAEAAPVPDEGKRWGYYDRSVLAVAVEAIKELNAKVEALEARVAELEG